MLTVNADGGYTYDPNHQFESLGAGQMTTDSFTYTMADREGATSSATVTVMIMGENDAPLAVDDVATANEDAILEGGGILSNDADPDADDSKAIVAINGQAGAVGTKIALPSGACSQSIAKATTTMTPTANLNRSQPERRRPIRSPIP